MDIYENTTIFIACPANYTSGGPELLHQLGSELLRRGLDARMWYYGIKDGRPPQEHVYRKYHVPFVISVDEDDDASENILLIPESAPGLYGWTKSMRKIFWWMSVDNYFTPLGKTFLMRPKYLFQKAICDTVYLFAPDPQMEHWVQSEYARQFVHMNRVPDTQVHFVGDYLQSAAHLQQMSAGGGLPPARQDIVAYNPKKGLAFTQQLMAAATDITWAPIENMTPEEVHALLTRAKVYIDFGNHPGQDRIPREAAAAGCCVITDRRGAAANDIDVPIPDIYKFDDVPQAIPAILSCIRSCLADYEGHVRDFDGYRAMIAGQKERFRRDVAAALPIRYDVPVRQRVVLQDGPHLKTFLSALLPRKDIEVIGIWYEERGLAAVKVGTKSIPVLYFEELPFLYQEGRFDAILLDSDTAAKDAERLQSAGLPENILC